MTDKNKLITVPWFFPVVADCLAEAIAIADELNNHRVTDKNQ